MPIRFVMLGGFLGAGKTTTIARLAHHYRSKGQNVAIVTNDQAENLVDTQWLRNQGFDVGEVAGSCFCCNFDGLIQQMDRLSEAELPDVILAEPVGSCTDLIATIAVPMAELLGDRFELGPYAVLLKPSHGRKILLNDAGRGFSPNAEYIFHKQLEEADTVVINRIDEMTDREADDLESAVRDRFPDRDVLRLSAKTGQNIDVLVESLERPAPRYQKFMEVDYDVYASGEAELGWLNATVAIESTTAFSLDEALMELMRRLKARLEAENAETAHLKAIAQAGQDSAVANLVSSESPIALSVASEASTRHARMVVNARVAIDPDNLQTIVNESVQSWSEAMGLVATIDSIQSFRPGRPVPTHRAGTH